MPKTITQYRVFIGTPGGLDQEREAFRQTLEAYTGSDAEPRGVTFHPVGWEDAIGGVGRPQELINEDLRQCDYAIFVWHDRWGSPTGNGAMVGTEEEWNVALELYEKGQVRKIGVFFKNVDDRQLRDPGEQLKQVLAHRKRVAEEKRHLFRSYDHHNTFCQELRKHLAQWLRDHEKGVSGTALDDLAKGVGPMLLASRPSEAPPATSPPNFRYWIEEARKLLGAGSAETSDYSDAEFCLRKAFASSASDLERAEANFALGNCQYRLNNLADALATFSELAEDLDCSDETTTRSWRARALVNKGVTLGRLGRSEEEIAVYDDLIVRLGVASEEA